MFCIYLVILNSSADVRLPTKIYSINGSITSISGSDDYIVIGSDNSFVYLFDKEGNLLWRYMLSDRITSVDIYNNVIAVTTIDRVLYLFNVSGDMEWYSEIESYPEYKKGLYIFRDMIVIGTRSGYVHFFQKTHEKWNYKTDVYVLQVSINKNGKTITAVSDKKVYVFDIYGRLLLNKSFPSYIRSAAISDDYIAVGLGNNELYLIDNDGDLLWRNSLPDQIGVIGVSDYIACGLRDGYVHIFDINGRYINKFKLNGPVISLSTLTNRLIVGTLNDRLYLINPYKGIKWDYKTRGHILSSYISRSYIVGGSVLGDIYYLMMFEDTEKSKIVTAFVIVSISIATMVLILSLRY